ncbi:conjugal transfer protein TraD [Niabella defluvii]|nr:conjugal transfer protein TraD [Niabella sp. I65]
MEILILICLIIVIVLLLHDKVRLNTQQDPKNKAKDSVVKQDPIDIMGKPKPVERLTSPNTDSKSQSSQDSVKANTFDTAIEEEGVDSTSPQEEPDEVAEASQPDWTEEEEEEWRMNREPDEEWGFAGGVTFEELDKAGEILKLEALTQEEERQVTGTLLKVQELSFSTSYKTPWIVRRSE